MENKKSYPPIQITMGKNLLDELGKNKLGLRENIGEGINNSIQAAINSGLSELNLYLDIEYSFINKNLNTICIDDFSSGMDYLTLVNALRPGQAPKNKKGLSEHGMGLNHLIAGIGNLEYIITKTKDMDHAIKINRYTDEPIDVEKINWDRDSGTSIKIKTRHGILWGDRANFSKNIRKLFLHFGAKYRYLLNIDEEDIPKNYIPKILGKAKLKFNLYARLTNLDDGKSSIEKIKPIFPSYYHPKTKENKPIIENIRFASGLLPGASNKKDKDDRDIIPVWEARSCLGHAPTADNLLEGSKWGDPYGVRPGIDIFVNGVMVVHRELTDLGIDLQKEGNSWGKLRGEIHLSTIDGDCPFTTTSAKNGIIDNENWSEFLSIFQQYLKDQDLYKAPVDNIKEFDICDKIYDRLVSTIGTPGSTIKEVIKGYISSDKGFPVDLTVVCFSPDPNKDLHYIYEVKINSAGHEEVLQPFGYALKDPKFEKKVVLIAKSLNPSGAETQKRLKEETNGYEVEFHELSKYGITDI
jgi:hypothetical protein